MNPAIHKKAHNDDQVEFISGMQSLPSKNQVMQYIVLIEYRTKTHNNFDP